MKKLIIYSVLISFIGCSSPKVMITVKYKSTKSSQKYYIDVPKGYTFKGYAVSINTEHLYIYNDSSFIYITNFHNTPNYYNIKELGDSIFQQRFQNEELTSEIKQYLGKSIIKPIPDTFELSGIQKSGLYWKDVKLGQISVGYVKVPRAKKDVFDKSIYSIRETKIRNKSDD